MFVENFPDRLITIEGKTYLYFGGTAYLGLSTHPAFQDILIESIRKWGTFYGSSRSSNIKLAIYNRFEDLFAQQIGAEAALTVSSGTLAGRLVIDFLSITNPMFYHYPKTHPAVLAKYSSPLFLDGKLQNRLLDDKKEEIIITVDAILGLEVEPISLDFLNGISPSKKITLVVDESHSLGVIGRYKMGIFDSIQHKSVVRKIMVSSLGKALSLSGGIIAGDQEFIDAIKQESTFISSSAANPAYLQLYLDSQHIYKSQQRQLQENLDYIEKNLHKNKELKFDKNYPVIYSEDDEIYNKLYREGIIITNFKYPTYKKMMNRIVITANHRKQDLERLVDVLNV